MESEVPKESPPPPEVVVPVSQPQPQPAKKPFKLNKWHVITVVLVVVICLQAFLYLSLTTDYNSLDSEHKALLREHVALEDDYSSLESSYASLQSEHSSLQSSYSSLQNSHSSLQASYNTLQSNYDALNENYQYLQASYNSFYSDYADLRSLLDQRTLHVDVTDFIRPYDPGVSNTVLSVTGGWSSPTNWNEFWADVEDMYFWVVNNIEYRSDGLFPVLPSTPSGSVYYREEMWQFPSETLDLRQGDCEDMAILLASMIRYYNGEEYWVECIEIQGYYGGHLAVQIPVTGDQLTILDPAGNYYTQTWYGSITDEDISVEINYWLSYWRSSLGSDVHVERVFSSYMDRSFSSTSEYTTWMYGR